MSIFSLNFSNTKNTFKSLIKFLILTQTLGIVYFLFVATKIPFGLSNFWGGFAGWVFLVTLIPGIVSRFEIKETVATIGQTLFFARTQLGISMFLAAFLHYILFIKNLMALGKFPPTEFMPFLPAGFLALFISFILFLTSNQQSKKLLKKNWFRLHKATYLILFLVFAHVALLGRGLFVFAFAAFIILEIASYGKVFLARKKA